MYGTSKGVPGGAWSWMLAAKRPTKAAPDPSNEEAAQLIMQLRYLTHEGGGR